MKRMKPFILRLLMVLSAMGISGSLTAQSDIWVGTWSCAPYAAGEGNTPPAPYLANNTLRQVIRVSIGGDTLRMKFSNKTSSTAVTLNKVNIAVSAGNSAIDPATVTELSFGGSASVTMEPYARTVSDPVVFPLEPGMRLAITIYYGDCSADVDITSHVASRTDSYIAPGDQAAAADFAGATVTAHWFHINTIDVMAPDTAGCVGVLGNSITDGYGLSGGLQNRWPDFMSRNLLDDERTTQVGVLNLGIGATVVAGTAPTSGVSRYQDDILDQSGLRWVIIFYGVNDIGWGRSAATVIEAYQDLIDRARALNIKVYGATVTPFKGHSYYTEAHEAVRQEVNAWIRTPGNFDACIDFDRIIRDPADTARMKADYSNDWLHPSVEGYELLGLSVDPGLFTDIENTRTLFANAGRDQSLLLLDGGDSALVILDGSGSISFGADIVSYVWTLGEEEIATGANPQVRLPAGSHTITLIVADPEGQTDSDNVVITVQEDKGIWLEAECGTVGSLWDINEDETASKGYYINVKPGNNSTGSASSGVPGRVDYTFEVEEGGTFHLVARVICPNANDDSFWLSMDRGSVDMWNNIGPSQDWSWESYGSTYNLTPGSHTLQVWYREDGAKLDKLWLTPHLGTVSGKGPEAGNCSMEALKADAGADTSYCNPLGTVRLGGEPAASGGTAPYTYCWTLIDPDLGAFDVCTIEILDDSSLPNPVLSNLPEINDTLVLLLQVRDLFREKHSDSVLVYVSSLRFKDSEVLRDTLIAGESREIQPENIHNGISPFTYLWSPVAGLSDPAARNPLAQPDSSTTYEVLVTDALGCTVTDRVELTVLPGAVSTGRIHEILSSRVFPNPVTSGSSIRLGDGPGGTFLPGAQGVLEVRVYNAQGQLVLVDHFAGREYPIGRKELEPGQYSYVASGSRKVLAYGNFIKI